MTGYLGAIGETYDNPCKAGYAPDGKMDYVFGAGLIPHCVPVSQVVPAGTAAWYQTEAEELSAARSAALQREAAVAPAEWPRETLPVQTKIPPRPPVAASSPAAGSTPGTTLAKNFAAIGIGGFILWFLLFKG